MIMITDAPPVNEPQGDPLKDGLSERKPLFGWGESRTSRTPRSVTIKPHNGGMEDGREYLENW